MRTERGAKGETHVRGSMRFRRGKRIKVAGPLLEREKKRVVLLTCVSPIGPLKHAYKNAHPGGRAS